MSEKVFVATYRAENGEERRVIVPGGGKSVPLSHTKESGLRRGWTGVYVGGEWRSKDEPKIHRADVDWGPWIIRQVSS